VSKRTRSIVKGAIAGLLGGIVGTAAKYAVERVYPPRIHGEPEPAALIADQISETSVQLNQEPVSKQSVHWAIGAATGAAYGAVAEFYPPATAKQGANFGIAMVALSHDSTLPLMGLASKPKPQTTREKTSEMVSHIAYGVVTETVRSIVRRMMA
jgi:putative membrane protein